MEFGRFPDKSTQSIDHAGPDWQGTFTSLVLRQIPTAADMLLLLLVKVPVVVLFSGIK